MLFLCQRVPDPPDRGDRITTHHFLRHLCASGARVHVGCFAEEDRDAEAVARLQEQLAGICAPRIHRGRRKWTSLRGLLSGQALSLPFHADPRLRRQIDAWTAAGPWDLVYVYSSSMAQYAERLQDCRRLMQFAELDSDKWRQYAERLGGPGAWIYRREARKLLAYERHIARTFDLSVVVSEVEKELFLQQIPEVTPLVLPNGVDTAHFAAPAAPQREPHTAVFTGIMDYEPNVHGLLWFVEECWPGLRQQFGDARLLVVGGRPTAQIQALHGQQGIEVTGRVPEIPPYLARASVSIAPLHLARGVQNKVLEAMSAGLPVVATPQASQGLGPEAAEVLAIHSEADATRTAVASWFADPAAAAEVGRRAADFVRARFSWETMYSRLDAALSELGLRGSGTPPAP